MKILNISSDYCKQSIYKAMAEQIDRNKMGIHQDIYVPIRSELEFGRNKPVGENIDIRYRFILSKKDRFFYKSKIKKIYRDLKGQFDVDDYDVVHAHFLFSDGGVAYQIWKEHGVPFVVAVRNTDINLFFKYALHLRAYGREILNAASRVVVLAPSYVDLLYSFLPETEVQALKSKIEVIPNAVDNFWLQHRANPKTSCSYSQQLLYVGDFTRNKNVPFVIKAKQKYFPEAVFHIVGGGGDDEAEITKLAEKDDNVVIHGRVEEKKVLLKHYRDADILCILSKRETFGVSYLEALSQGTPIIYTKGQGVDGYFEKPVGEAVAFGDTAMFIKAVQNIAQNYDQYSGNSVEAIGRFNWNTISNQYIRIYEDYGSKN